MIDYCKKGYGEQYESVSPGLTKPSNEVVIIIRDGTVVAFMQKSGNRLVEGMYGDGI